MQTDVMYELKHSRNRLEYYTSIKEKSSNAKTPALDKWIEIYSDRVSKLERQASKLGLKTQLAKQPTQVRSA